MTTAAAKTEQPGSGRPRLTWQASWFVVAGTSATAVHAGLFLLFRQTMDVFLANLVALTIAAIANTAFHRRVTFRAPDAYRLRRYVSIVLTVAFYATYTSAALMVLHIVVSGPTATQQTATIVGAAAFGGLARFVLLRHWVFAHPRAEHSPT